MLETVQFVPGNPPSGHEILVAIATDRLSSNEAEQRVAALAPDLEKNRVNIAFLLHAVDSTRLSLATRRNLGLPIIAGQGEGSIKREKGPTLLQTGQKYWQKYEELCPDAEKNYWVSRNYHNAEPGILVFDDLLEVKSEGIVVGMPQRTFEHIDALGRGHVFLDHMLYKPYPPLYEGSPVTVSQLKKISAQVTYQMEEQRKRLICQTFETHYSQAIWIANREFSDKRYSLVDQALR